MNDPHRFHRITVVLLVVLAVAATVGLAREGDTRIPSSDEIERIRELSREQEHVRAATVARDLIARMEDEYGAESAPVGAALDELVRALLEAGEFRDPDFVAASERALRIREERFGSRSREVAIALNKLGSVYRYHGDFELSRDAFLRSLNLREELAPDEPWVATAQVNLGIILHKMGLYTEARGHLESAIRIREERFGFESVGLVTPIQSLANLLDRMGQPENALPLYHRALEIAETVHGPDDPRVAEVLNNLGVLIKNQGQFVEAERLFRRGLAIREQVHGPDHREVARSLNNLAIVRSELGHDAEARLLWERALAIRIDKMGENHPMTTRVRNNLANLMRRSGDHDAARAEFESVLAARVAAFGDDHQRVADVLLELAITLIESGRFDSARSRLDRCLSIYDGIPGSIPTRRAEALIERARLELWAGNLPTARRYVDDALPLLDSVTGHEVPLRADALNVLGEIHLRSGEFDQAEAIFRNEVESWTTAVETDASRLARALNHLAETQQIRGRCAQAIKLGLRAERIARAHFRQMSSVLSEREMLLLAGVLSSGKDIATTCLLDESTPRGTSARAVWDALVRSRGMVLDEMSSRRKQSRHSSDDSRRSFDALRDARSHLARLIVAGPGDSPWKQYRREIARAEKRIDRCERSLLNSSRDFRETRNLAGVGFKELRNSLAEDDSLVAYVRYDQIGWTRMESGSGQVEGVRESIPSLAAFVLPAGRTTPGVVPLGPASEIDDLVTRWQAEVSKPPRGMASPGGRAESEYRVVGDRLRKAIWDPVAPLLSATGRVFVVPDGSLGLVSLATLPLETDRYLVESDRVVHYLSAERDLLRNRPRGIKHGLLAMGGPNFGTAPMVTDGNLRAEREITFRGRTARCPTVETLNFDPLPGSASEVAQITALWSQKPAEQDPGGSSAVSWIGDAASEGAFKRNAPRHAVLHLATHGFFCDRASGVRAADAGAGDEKPLWFSGLAFAGANQGQGRLSESVEDGILTSEEITELDFSGVEWAVLSACETGLGEVRAGEGVFGLRRAFDTAGVGTLIMSLWSIDDIATQKWMLSLYEARLAGQSTADAMRHASVTTLERRRANGVTTHPFYWGAFVAAGDWR